MRGDSSLIVRVAVPIVLVGCFGVIVMMMHQPLFNFQYEGVLMLLQEGTNFSTNKTYTLINIPQDVPSLVQ